MPGNLDDLKTADRRPHRRRRRVWPWVLGIGLGVIVVLAGLGIAGVALAGQALEVRDDLEAAKSELSSVPALVREGDTEQFEAVAASVLAHTSSADETVQGPLWEFATWIPGVGPNIDAVRQATIATHILVRDAMPASFDVLAAVNIDQVSFGDAGFDLAPFQAVIDVLPQVDDAFMRAREHVAGIDRAALLPIVDDAVGQVIDVIDDSAPLVHTATAILPSALDMLGQDGKRTYFVMFQNNAEIRATGGNPAASMIMTVDNGKIELLDQASSATFYEAGTQFVKYTDLPGDMLSLYLPTVDRHSQDFTMTPDFPTTALLFQNLWTATNGSTFDGVISIDPVVLADALSVAGPLTLSDGEQITADNAVKVLLSDAYERYPNGADSDAFFADVAQQAFTHLTTPTWDPVKMYEVLQQSAREQRIYMSFQAEDEQALVEDLGLDGALQTDTASQTQLGIYLNDYSVGKLEYYLTTSLSATCDADARTATVTMTMKNSVPGSELTGYVLGLRNGTYGYTSRDMMLDVLYFAPPGATIVSTDPGTGDVPSLSRTGVEKGNTAKSELVTVRQGETRTVSYTVQLPEGELGPLQLRYSPTANSTTVEIADSCAELMGSAADE